MTYALEVVKDLRHVKKGIPVAGPIHVALLDTALGHCDAVTRWLDGEHAARVVASGDWGRLRRYQCSTDRTLQLLVYGRAGTQRPAPPAPFRSDVGRRLIRTYLAHSYDQISAHGALAETPRFVNAITVELTPHGAQEFSDWYDRAHVPEILDCPGWLGARRFRARSPEARYLAMYDLADPVTPFSSPEYERAVGWDNLEHHLLGYHGFRTYELAADTNIPALIPALKGGPS